MVDLLLYFVVFIICICNCKECAELSEDLMFQSKGLLKRPCIPIRHNENHHICYAQLRLVNEAFSQHVQGRLCAQQKV